MTCDCTKMKSGVAHFCVVMASYAQGDGAIGVALRAGGGGALVDVDMTELVHPKTDRAA